MKSYKRSIWQQVLLFLFILNIGIDIYYIQVYTYIIKGTEENKMKKEMTLAEIFEAWEKAAKEIEKTDKYEGNYKGLGCVLESGFKMLMED